ncbi:Alpha/beta hydrolase family protein [Corynebacterium ciconiae DSM 44920]|uniref:poly(ethylene terephthalate) hydrolase family protein n=1 Tax=Corynebacterium ciconiae TaxID=227319 RepID=UPI0003714DC2|nr:alpha/beta hydrolase [Corynebacterium ciconiae]WKD60307.1 Alpha/beta hydrolase family protein [Corynebacterium ciconiae DSM 44920]
MSLVSRRRTAAVALLSTTALLLPQHAMADPALPPAPEVSSSAAHLPDLPHDIAPPFVPDQLRDAGLTGLRLTAPYNEAPGAIRSTFGERGPHEVASTAVARHCTDAFYVFYNTALRYQNGVNSEPPCYGTWPSGPESPIGSQLVYPADITSSDPAPLIVLSPGIVAEPGMLSRQAELYASHGYVVAIGYTWVNWFGHQVELAATAAIDANTTPGPLQGKIDTSRTILVGHSAGGGSVMRVAESLGPSMHAVGDENFTVRGVVGANPGPADFGLASEPTTKPALVLFAEHETLVAHPLSEMLYNNARGPKWRATVNNAFHGTFVDAPERSVYAGLVLSFSEYVLTNSQRTRAIYNGEGLAQDSELHNVQRANVG